MRWATALLIVIASACTRPDPAARLDAGTHARSGAATSTAAIAVRTTTAADMLALLPQSGDAQRILAERCLLCHGLEHVAQQRLPLAKWTAVIDKMARWGTPLAAGEAELLARALAEALPPELPDVPPRRVPTRP